MPRDIPPVAVSMKSLYCYMKHILNEFGLPFGEMDKVVMEFTPHTVKFTHKQMEIETSNTFINSQY